MTPFLMNRFDEAWTWLGVQGVSMRQRIDPFSGAASGAAAARTAADAPDAGSSS